MATTGTLHLAARLVAQLDAPQSQGSITSQARDCWPIVQALGYYDLADHLKALGGETVMIPAATVTTDA